MLCFAPADVAHGHRVLHEVLQPVGYYSKQNIGAWHTPMIHPSSLFTCYVLRSRAFADRTCAALCQLRYYRDLHILHLSQPLGLELLKLYPGSPRNTTLHQMDQLLQTLRSARVQSEWDDLSELASEALTQHPEKWRVMTLRDFSSIPVRAKDEHAEIKAGYVDSDSIGSRYIYDYNDITNLHAMLSGHNVRGFGNTYEAPNTLWISDLDNKFLDSHFRGPYMNPHGCMQGISHLKFYQDVMKHAPSLWQEAAKSNLLSVDLVIVNYSDKDQCDRSDIVKELLREEHRPFKVVLKVRLFDVWHMKPLTRFSYKSDLRLLLHEVACTPIKTLPQSSWMLMFRNPLKTLPDWRGHSGITLT